MRKFLATTVAGLSLATGSIAVTALSPMGTAFAQDATAQTEQPAEAQHSGRHMRRGVAKAAIKNAATTIGVTPQELVTAIRNGQSIADVARDHGVDPQTVIDNLITEATARIDQAVLDGKIPAEKAEELKHKLTGRVTSLVNRHFEGKHHDAAGTPAG